MPPDDVGLLFKFRADSRQAREEIGQFRRKVEQDVEAVESTGTRAFNSLGKAVGLNTTQMAGFRAALPGVAAGVGTVGTALLAASAAAFALVKNASDAGSVLFDLKAKTGLGAESLSTLKLAADQSGSSIEQASQAFVVYQKNLTEAARKGEALFGIDARRAVNDSEFAIRALTELLNGPMPAGYNKTTLAAQLMGEAGANLIPTFDTLGGSFDKAIERARRLGVILTEEDLKAADDFGDTLDALSAQAGGLANKFALELAPAITKAMQSISESFITHRDTVKDVTGAVVTYLSSELDKLNGILSALGLASAYLKSGSGYGATVAVGGEYARQGAHVVSTAGGGRSSLMGTDETVVDTKLMNAELARLKKQEEEAKRLAAQTAKELERQAKEAEREAERARKEAEAAAKRSEQERIEALDRYLAAVQLMHRRQMELFELRAREDVARWKAQAQAGIISYAEAERRIAAEFARGFNQRSKFLEEELKHTRHSAEARAEIEHQQNVLEEEAHRFKRQASASLTDARIEDLERLEEAYRASQERMKSQGVDPFAPPAGLMGAGLGHPSAALGPIVDESGMAPPPAMRGEWEKFADTVLASMEAASGGVQSFTNLAAAGFGRMSQAVGSAVQGWVLYGNSIGKAMKQALAAVLASIAAESAVRAIFELAKGFASLFFNPAAAAAHFKAAALFGAVAAGAGIAGRAVAGNAFASGGGGAGGGGGGGSSNPYDEYEGGRTRREREQAEADRYTRHEDRRGDYDRPIVIELDGSALGRGILRIWGDNSGDLRNGVKTDLRLA
jgi:hypothetical protein